MNVTDEMPSYIKWRYYTLKTEFEDFYKICTNYDLKILNNIIKYWWSCGGECLSVG